MIKQWKWTVLKGYSNKYLRWKIKILQQQKLNGDKKTLILKERNINDIAFIYKKIYSKEKNYLVKSRIKGITKIPVS